MLGGRTARGDGESATPLSAARGGGGSALPPEPHMSRRLKTLFCYLTTNAFADSKRGPMDSPLRYCSGIMSGGGGAATVGGGDFCSASLRLVGVNTRKMLIKKSIVFIFRTAGHMGSGTRGVAYGPRGWGERLHRGCGRRWCVGRGGRPGSRGGPSRRHPRGRGQHHIPNPPPPPPSPHRHPVAARDIGKRGWGTTERRTSTHG